MPQMFQSVSVVVPAYNAASYLTSTVESILANALSQIIIVNDGSSDNTLEVAVALAKHHSNIQVVNQKNQGVSAARNAGLNQARGEYVMFLDADDLLFPNAIIELKSVLDNHKDAVAAYGKVNYIDKTGNDLPIKASKGKHLSKVSPDNLICSNFTDTLGTMLIRAKAVRRVDGFDTTLKAAEDWEFYNRLIRFGDILFADINACKYRLHQNSAMSNLSFESFNLASVKVHEEALKNGYTRLRLANANARRLSGLFLLFARREKSYANKAFLSVRSILYISLSFPYYFSIHLFLQSCKMLVASFLRIIVFRNNTSRIN